MNARATRRGVPAIALWGGLGALAWATITVLTGGGSAQADEQKDPSLLGEVSSLVTGTVSTVGDTVTAVTEPIVTQVVAPVVNQVVAPVVHDVVVPVPETVPAVVEDVTDTVAEVPVVGDVATPVVETVTDTAQAVVTPVADLLQDAPVSQIVDPVQDAVAALPVVGGLLRDLGVTKLLDDVTGVVDDTTGIVGEVVESTVPPVLVGLDPTESLPPVVLPPVVVPDPGFAAVPTVVPVEAAGATAVSTLTPAPRHPLDESALSAPVDALAPATTASASGHASGPATAPLGGPLAPSSSATSGGASAVSPAGLTDAGVPALRAEERTSGASDDVLPTSLVADTDVSPD
ncbi:hypothetical protein [Microbacterium sp. NPDC087868]|uniref:hypothetical protein n=1 Tax=Microbacterium sp. NPDC087868 TaxID=3364195 RepID=UPI003850B93B